MSEPNKPATVPSVDDLGPQNPDRSEPPDCYRCKHRGLTLANIYCRAHERDITPSGVVACYRWQPAIQQADGRPDLRL